MPPVIFNTTIFLFLFYVHCCAPPVSLLANYITLTVHHFGDVMI